MATGKPLVLVVGATGYTGHSIVNGLLDFGALVRPASVSKPGVETRVGDIAEGVEKLKGILVGVDVLISVTGSLSAGAEFESTELDFKKPS
ncbi:hypothetical protein BD413DRAFT_615759 [Trametes elegans]|nr:hypothetical protein BD413DRAFT_615759 [Trametes elegans]